jgi:UDP-N-acetylmuramate dehydrogenase
MTIKPFEPLVTRYGDRVKLDEVLARYTVARLGGTADALIVVDSEAMLKDVVQLAWEYQWPTRIIGAGANVLFSDLGYRGLIVINHARQIAIDDDLGRVTAGSGAVLTHITRQSVNSGLSGFEWAVSVPGTLGGAIVNNAGAHGGDIANCLVSAEIAFPQHTETWPVARFEYQYRESALKRRSDPFVVLSGSLHLAPGLDPAVLQARAEEWNAQRKRTQPPGASLGSMFKNPPGDYAGRLIEAAGLKGSQIGGVMISPVHANFFVNTGGGTAADYLALIRRARDVVRERLGIELGLEVELIGEGYENF